MSGSETSDGMPNMKIPQTNNVCKITASKLAEDGLFSPAVIFIVNIIKTNKVNQIQFTTYINSLKSF